MSENMSKKEAYEKGLITEQEYQEYLDNLFFATLERLNMNPYDILWDNKDVKE